ncbi:MAG: ABC transporter ATP-binding protein [Balneola sp.]|nr:MAG: ABC transporter ATP-binding protein [Balneola sp.]
MLQTKNLTKKYNETVALNNLNLSIEKGEIFCLLGANGAGKTTTINLLMNFIQPTSGEAFINGLEVTKNSIETKKHLAYIPENLVLYNELTGLENLEYFLGLAGIKYANDDLEAYLMEAGLQSEAFNNRVKTYSKGMRQKIGIALAIAKNATVLLLDEPTSGLDPKASNEFSELLIRLSEHKVATLMATHDLFRAKETGTHIGIMKAGDLLENISTDSITHSELEELYLNQINN